MFMHKNKVSAEQDRIKALKEELQVLELKQQEQGLQEQVNDKAFWTRHKSLRGAVEGVKSGVQGYGQFLVKDVVPAMKGGLKMTSKAMRDYSKSSGKSLSFAQEEAQMRREEARMDREERRLK